MMSYKALLEAFHGFIDRRRKPAGVFLAILGFAGFVFSDTAYKYASGSYPVMVMGFYGWLATFLVLLTVLFVGGNVRRTLATRKPGLHLLRGCILCLNFFLFVYGISGLPMAQTYAIDNASPMVATLLAVVILGQKLNRYRVLCIIVGFIGVLIVLRPGFIPLNIHAVAVLLSTLSFALSNILTSKIGDEDSPLAFAFYGLIVGLIIQGGYNLFHGWMVPLPQDLLVLAGAGIFAFIGLVSLNKAFLLVDVALASKFQYTQLLWGVLIGYILFGDVPDLWTVAGAFVIVCSGATLVYYESKKVSYDG